MCHVATSVKMTPGLQKGCPHQNQCPVVPEQTCTGARAVYKLQCTNCQAACLETSGHTLHKRNMEHLEAVRGGNMAYAMTKNYAADHPEWTPASGMPFSSSILKGPNIKANLNRYIGEAIHIRKHTESGATQLNGHGEWGRTVLRRLAIVED